MNIREILLNEIPDNGHDDEALTAIQSITATPKQAKLVCHLAHKFVVEAKVAGGSSITLQVPGFQSVTIDQSKLVSALRRLIYETDAAIEEGSYRYSEPSCFALPDDRPPPLEDMDIPVWDEKRGCWRDAEW